MREMNAQDLGNALWNCADEMRGIMDANEYKDYLLGLVFYKALSDNELYTVMDVMEDRKPASLDEAQALYESQVGTPVWEPLQKELEGRFNVAIQPNRTFNAFIKAIDDKKFLLADLKEAFAVIENAQNSFYDGLFEGFDIFSLKLGEDKRKRNTLIAHCMKRMAVYDFSRYGNDILGDAYEYLIAMFAENSGKKAGEFYTPQMVSKILTAIVTHGKEDVDGYSIYDACCGSASLLLNVKHYLNERVRGHVYYFGQEKNRSTYRLARMNCLLHQIPYQYQHFRCGDTLDTDWPTDEPTTFHGVTMNPPYSAKWPAPESMLTDPRFAPYEKLAPKGKADYAFLLHGFYHLREDGMMGIVMPLGVLFRGKAEGTIRRHLIENGSIYAVVGLAPNLFYSTGIPVCLVFLKKDNKDRSILFVDATKEFKKGKARNVLTKENADKIIKTVLDRKDVDKFAHLAPYMEIVHNKYNLNIPRYVDSEEEEPEVDLRKAFADYDAQKKIETAADRKLQGFFKELGIVRKEGQ